MSKSKSLICLSIFIIIGTIGCFHFKASPAPDKVDLTTLDPNLYDQSWLTNDSCEVACWHGIKPGVTSKENTLLIVSELPLIDNSKMEAFGGTVNYPCKIPNNITCVRITYSNGILEYLDVTPNYPITIGQAVEKLGDPNGYRAGPTDPSATGCSLGLVWKKKQLIFGYTEYRSGIPFWGRDLCQQIRDNNGKIPKDIKDIIVSDVLYIPSDYVGLRNYNAWVGFEN